MGPHQVSLHVSKVEISLCFATPNQTLQDPFIGIFPASEFITNGPIVWVPIHFLQKSGASECTQSNIVGEGDQSVKLVLVEAHSPAYAGLHSAGELVHVVLKVSQSVRLAYALSTLNWATVRVPGGSVANSPYSFRIPLIKLYY